MVLGLLNVIFSWAMWYGTITFPFLQDVLLLLFEYMSHGFSLKRSLNCLSIFFKTFKHTRCPIDFILETSCWEVFWSILGNVLVWKQIFSTWKVEKWFKQISWLKAPPLPPPLRILRVLLHLILSFIFSWKLWYHPGSDTWRELDLFLGSLGVMSALSAWCGSPFLVSVTYWACVGWNPWSPAPEPSCLISVPTSSFSGSSLSLVDRASIFSVLS